MNTIHCEQLLQKTVKGWKTNNSKPIELANATTNNGSDIESQIVNVMELEKKEFVELLRVKRGNDTIKMKKEDFVDDIESCRVDIYGDDNEIIEIMNPCELDKDQCTPRFVDIPTTTV